MSKKGLFTVFLFIFIPLLFICLCCGSLFLLIAMAGAAAPDDNIVLETYQDNDSSDQIAVIDIEGVIAADTTGTGSDTDMVEMILRKLEKAEDDDNVKAIILRLNTPGGTVYDSDKIAREVKRIDSEEKPIVAYMESSATSGGYYISAPTSRIVASPTSITGSIGVIAQVIELDGLYEKLGIEVINVTNTQGDVKAMENLEDSESEDRAILESLLDDHFEEFVKIVMEGRGMTRDQVIALANGSIYSGNQAEELNLVDELGDFSTAISAAEEEADIDDADIIIYKTYSDPWSGFGSLIEANINPLSSVNKKIQKEPGTYSYYMPE